MPNRDTPNKSMMRLVSELMELLAAFGRQQARVIVSESLSEPLRRAGSLAAMGIAAGIIMATAGIFVGIGLMLLLSKVLRAAWAAFLIVGVCLGLFATGVLMARRWVFKP